MIDRGQMGKEIIYNLCQGTEPFIIFDVEIKPKQIISCIGYELVCSNPKCDCHLIDIAVCKQGTKDVITYINYGWRDCDYYISRGHTKNDAIDSIQGKLPDYEPKTEENKSILLAFREWLSKNKTQKDQIIADRYEQFKSIVRNRQMSKARNVKLKKFFSMMHELFGERKVEEFIAGCEQGSKIGYVTDAKKSQ